MSFETWLSGRSEPRLPAIDEMDEDEMAAAAPIILGVGTMEWSFTFGAEEPMPMVGVAGARVRNVVLDLEGRLVRKGEGNEPGQGTCHEYWVRSVEMDGGTAQEEVPQGTPGAVPRRRGDAGDLLLHLDDGRERWCTAHHVTRVEPNDGEPAPEPPPPLARTEMAAGAPPVTPIVSPPPPPVTPVVPRPPPPVTPGAPIPPEMDIEEARAARLRKHDEMRALLTWLEVHRFRGKQALADALGCDRSMLSHYMHGTGRHGGKLLSPDLAKMHGQLLSGLRRADLPTEIPPLPADPAGASLTATSASSAAARSTPASAARSTPAFAAPVQAPKHPVLTVALADVEDAREGGHVHIMALGQPVERDLRWIVDAPGSDGASMLRLRDGLRGRRTFKARAGSSMGGRTFEWWVERLEDRRDPTYHGGPLWVARELTGTMATLGERIVGRALVASGGGQAGKSTAALLCRAIERHCEGAKQKAVAFTGLIHPSVQMLLEVSDEELADEPGHVVFGARCGGDLTMLRRERLRLLGAAAGEAFVYAMDSVCPGNPEGAWHVLLHRRAFQTRFLPEELRHGLSRTHLRDKLLQMPFVKTFVQARVRCSRPWPQPYFGLHTSLIWSAHLPLFWQVYGGLPNERLRRQHLSMFAPHFSYTVTQDLFGVSEWKVYQARHHAAEYGGARPVPPRVGSFRIKPEAAEHLNAFANSPENVQIIATYEGKARKPIIELKQVPEKLWLKYAKVTPEELRVSRSKFLEFLNQPGVFRILRAKSCLCGPCNEHGTLNFEAFAALLEKLGGYVGSTVAAALKLRAGKLHGYLAHEFRGRCALRSPVATQCIMHALCGSGAFGGSCGHATHTMDDEKDNERFYLIEDTRKALAALRGKRPESTSADDWQAELDIMTEDLALIEQQLELYVQHLVRKALSSTITPRCLEALPSHLTRMHLIFDYKQKWLPVKHGETQSDAFGKRGKSIWGCTAIRWNVATEDFEVLNVRLVCDDSTQNWFHSLACMRTTCDILHRAWLDIDEATCQSDGAGNFSCTAFTTSLPRVGETVGIRILELNITEVGDGKNLCDTDFQQVTMALNQRKDGGADIETAQQMLDNLDANPTAGTVNAGMELGSTRRLEPGKKQGPKPYKGIDGIYQRKYEYDANGRCTGIRMHQFYELGEGNLVSMASMRALWTKGMLDVGRIDPTRLQPSAGEAAIESKVKRSDEHKLSAQMEAQRKRAAKEAKAAEQVLELVENERARQLAATVFTCKHTGCCHRVFLTSRYCCEHEDNQCPFRPEVQSTQSVSDCCVKVTVRVSKAPTRLALAVTSEGVKATVDVPLPTRLALSVRRALAPVKAYGLQAYRILPHASIASAAEVDAACDREVRLLTASLAVTTSTSGGTRVALTLELLKSRRLPPEPAGKGWAIRPPAMRTVLTEEQRLLLVECFESADRPNEAQAHARFKARFTDTDRDGKFARKLVRSAAQIKAWFSAEKQRRQKSGVVHAVATAALDEEDGTEEAAAVGGGDGGRGGGGGGGGGGDGGGGGGGKWPDVPTMRKEMGALGHAAEAKAARGTKAVRIAWAFANQNPRAAARSSSAQRQSEKVTRHLSPSSPQSEPAWHGS